MPQDPSDCATRRPRSDGERNRVLLIEAAKNAFAARGAGASLEQIARDAGVGIGTLYRHFPSRDALLSATYSEERDALIEAKIRLEMEMEPIVALREWLLLFVRFLDAKHGMAAALSTIAGGPGFLYSETSVRLKVPIDALVGRAMASCNWQSPMEPIDILYAISGVANVRYEGDWKRSAIGMIDLLIGGMAAAERRSISGEGLERLQ